MDDYQMLFNIVVGTSGLLGGYVLSTIRSSLNHLQMADTVLCEKVNKLEVLVAGDYVKRVEVDEQFKRLEAMLVRIEKKIENDRV